MAIESLLTPAEIAGRAQTFVWNQDFSPVAQKVIFSEEAKKVYGDIDQGIRVSHVVNLCRHLQGLLKDLPADVKEEDSSKLILKDQITNINTYLNKIGVLALTETADLAPVPNNATTAEVPKQVTLPTLGQVA